MESDWIWRCCAAGVGMVPWRLRQLVPPQRDTVQCVDIAALASIVVIGIIALAIRWSEQTIFSTL